MPATKTTNRDRTIAELIAIRDSAALDLATMPSVKQGSEWATDRQRDILWANRSLERLGVIPTMTKVED